MLCEQFILGEEDGKERYKGLWVQLDGCDDATPR